MRRDFRPLLHRGRSRTFSVRGLNVSLGRVRSPCATRQCHVHGSSGTAAAAQSWHRYGLNCTPQRDSRRLNARERKGTREPRREVVSGARGVIAPITSRREPPLFAEVRSIQRIFSRKNTALFITSNLKYFASPLIIRIIRVININCC